MLRDHEWRVSVVYTGRSQYCRPVPSVHHLAGAWCCRTAQVSPSALSFSPAWPIICEEVSFELLWLEVDTDHAFCFGDCGSACGHPAEAAAGWLGSLFRVRYKASVPGKCAVRCLRSRDHCLFGAHVTPPVVCGQRIPTPGKAHLRHSR